jgi:DNA-binding MarR family transcriptional regulator
MEYLFLYTIHYTGSIRKTDIIQLHLVDFSTGMDIIKRLLKQGFITEKTDDSDKRTKLITLTEQGGNALQKTMKKADQERMMFFSAIDENKWKKILPVLEEIHDFHNDVYHRYHNKNEAELRNLIASLRYFYK